MKKLLAILCLATAGCSTTRQVHDVPKGVVSGSGYDYELFERPDGSRYIRNEAGKVMDVAESGTLK